VTIYLTLIGALVVTHAMLRRLTSRRCIIIIIIIIILPGGTSDDSVDINNCSIFYVPPDEELAMRVGKFLRPVEHAADLRLDSGLELVRSTTHTWPVSD